MEKYLVLKTDGTIEEVDVNSYESSYKALSENIGGIIQCIRWVKPFAARGIDLWIHDEGKLLDLDLSLAITDNGRLVEVLNGNIVIKMQHNCMSDKKTYSNNNFIPIVHEYLLIVQKEIGTIYDIKLSKNYKSDMRDEMKSTWKDVLMAILSSYNAPVSLSCLYSAMEGHKKTDTNRFWKEKIRQTLHQYSSIFVQDEKGLWQLAA